MTRGLVKQPLSWSSTFHALELDAEKVHLWLAFPGDNVLGQFGHDAWAWLGEHERLRALRLSDTRQRTLYLEARIGLKILIQAYTGLPGDQVMLEYGPRGKPELGQSLQWLQFNYSMSSGYVLYAFSRDRELGVDLEMHPRDVHVQRLSNRILSKPEKQYFDNLPKNQKHAAILDWWTRKEAYGKLLGVGIRYNMSQTNLLQDPDSFCWKSPVSGLFDEARDGPRFGYVYGTQVGLPTNGSAALMYNSPGSSRYHPDIQAFDFSSIKSKAGTRL